MEIIGTNASSVSRDEWCIGLADARELIEGDWLYWGDLLLDIDEANIHERGDVAWLSVPGTVSQHIDTEEGYKNYFEYI